MFFIGRLVVIFALLCGIAQRCAVADTGPWFPFGHPTGAALESATQTDSAGNPLLYGGSTDQSDNYQISQWHTTGDLGPMSYVPSTNQWTSANAISAFHWYPPVNGQAASIMIAQNGQYLPCSNGEFDMIFGPNGQGNANNPSQYPPNATSDTARINLMTHLYMSGTYTLNGTNSAVQQSSYRCDVNQANTALSVVLLNKQTNPYQFFFYNLHLTEVCAQSGTSNDQYSTCQQGLNNQQINWFWTGTSNPTMHSDGLHPQWGVDDHLNSYGASNITDMNSHGLSIDLLPKLRQLIQSNPYNMDPDQSHWEVTGYSFGQATWGGVYIGSTFKDFVLLYSCMENVPCPANN